MLTSKEFIKEIIASERVAVSALVREFEQRKKAYRNKNAKVKNTGIIDVNKLASYKTSDEIFLSRKKIGDAKSHGFVSLVDWSGSMNHSNRKNKCIKQILILHEFCRRCNIPYEIYAYTSDCYRDKEVVEKLSTNYKKSEEIKEYQHVKTTFSLNISGFQDLKLIKVLSSDMKGKALDNAYYQLAASLTEEEDLNEIYRVFTKLELAGVPRDGYRYDDKDPMTYRNTETARELFRAINNERGESENTDYSWNAPKDSILGRYGMGYTPTVEALIVLDKILENFKRRYNPQKMTMIHMTDGDLGTINAQACERSERTGKMVVNKSISIDSASYATGWNSAILQNPPEGVTDMKANIVINGHTHVADFDNRRGDEAKLGIQKNPEKSFMVSYINYLKKKYKMTAIGYFLYNDTRSYTEFFTRGLTNYYVEAGELKELAKKYKDVNGNVAVKDLYGYDSFIFLQDKNFNQEVEMKIDEEKKITASALRAAATKTLNADSSKFIAKKLMEAAA